MVRLPFLKPKQISNKFLTIDIGSNSVKVLAFNLDTQSSPVKASVIGKSQEDLLEDSTRGGVIVDLDDVEQALGTAIREASRGEKISDVIFGVGGSLAMGIMVTIKVTRGEDLPISENELSEVFDKIYEEAYNKIDNIFLEVTGDSETDMSLVTSSVVYKKLDGKKVEELEGQQGREIEIATFISFSPDYHLKSLKKIAKRLKLNTLAISSDLYAFTKGLSLSKGKDYDAVVINIGGEVTDVAVVFRGGVAATRSLDIGGAHFTKKLSEKMDMSFEDAEHKKMEYSYGRVNKDEEFMIKEHIDDILNVWLSGIELLFHQFIGVKTFPHKVYLTGGGSALPDIYEAISKEPWTKSIPFKSPPEFSKVTIEDLALIEDRMREVHSVEDIIPTSLSIVYLEIKDLI